MLMKLQGRYVFTHSDRDLYILSYFINKLGNGGNSQDKIVERVFLKKKKKKKIVERVQKES